MRRRAEPAEPERDVQARCLALLKRLGLTWFHATDAQRSPADLLDLTVFGGTRLLHIEVKKDGGVLTPGQVKRHNELVMAHESVLLLQPSSEPQVHAMIESIVPPWSAGALSPLITHHSALSTSSPPPWPASLLPHIPAEYVCDPEFRRLYAEFATEAPGAGPHACLNYALTQRRKKL